MAKKSKYENFDVAMLEAIACGARTFWPLCERMKEQAKPLATNPNEYWRVVDRRLQAMRKLGLCSVSREGRQSIWSIHV